MSDDSKQKQIEELTADLLNAKETIFDENLDKEKRAAELVIANKELAFQNKEKKSEQQSLSSPKKNLHLLTRRDKS